MVIRSYSSTLNAVDKRSAWPFPPAHKPPALVSQSFAILESLLDEETDVPVPASRTTAETGRRQTPTRKSSSVPKPPPPSLPPRIPRPKIACNAYSSGQSSSTNTSNVAFQVGINSNFKTLSIIFVFELLPHRQPVGQLRLVNQEQPNITPRGDLSKISHALSSSPPTLPSTILTRVQWKLPYSSTGNLKSEEAKTTKSSSLKNCQPQLTSPTLLSLHDFHIFLARDFVLFSSVFTLFNASSYKP
nr:hypothetical protein HmN_000964800 [Hymenolepis microstoma]